MVNSRLILDVYLLTCVLINLSTERADSIEVSSVQNGSRDFVLEGDAGAKTELILAAASDSAAGGFTWAAPSATLNRRRTWLDTFDWRLYRAGLTLEQVVSRGRTELVLTGRDGEVLAQAQLTDGGRLHWPSLISALPAGPLREQLEPVVGVRALLAIARATSRVRERRALNGDDKTIARLFTDQMAVTYPVRAAAAPRLTLMPLRGYHGQADRVGRALSNLPGVTNGNAPTLDIALRAADRRPGELTGKAAAVRLRGSTPATRALATTLTALFDALEANVPGTISDIDTEFLHDLRIAVRWTRSAIKLCGGALPDGVARRFRPEFRWLGDLTTPTRDLDVYLLGYASMSAALVGATEAELTPFHDYLTRSRKAAHTHLLRGLRSARFARLHDEWRDALADMKASRRRTTVAQLAAEQIKAAQRRALAAGRSITPASPAESLHDLRKRCKELRYLVEMFGSLHDPSQRWQAVRELKALQDCLGEFQDAEVQRAEIHAFAAQMLADRSAPAATLLAMGEIAAGLALRQHQARNDFDSRFAAFASRSSQARLSALAKSTIA